MHNQNNKVRPIFTIWLKPKKTFQYLDNREPEDNKFNLTIIYVIITFGFIPILMFENKDLLKDNLFFWLLFIPFFAIGIGLLFLKYIIPTLLWGVGKILQGKANLYETQLVFAYSLTPYFIILILSILFLVPAFLIDNISIVIHQSPITIIIVNLFILRNVIYGLSYFNKFSYGYALLNIFITCILLFGLRFLLNNINV